MENRLNKFLLGAAVFLLIVTAVLLGLSVEADARTVCREDWSGKTVCTDSSGGRTTIEQDWSGDTIIRDNHGNRTRCREDWAGNIVCN